MFPRGMRPNHRVRIIEVWAVIGAEVEFATVAGTGGGLREEGGLHDSMLMMPGFWPRIGEEDKQSANSHVRWDDVQEQRGLGLDEEQIRQLGAGAFSFGPRDAIGSKVNPDTYFLGMGLCVGSEEMAVSAPYFPREPVGICQDLLKLGFQLGASGGDACQKLRRPFRILRVGLVHP